MISTTDYIGQLVPQQCHNSLTPEAIKEIKSHISKDLNNHIQVAILVASTNALKIQAAKTCVESWLLESLGNKWEIEVTAFDVASEIDEQPHGLDQTIFGASNRLKNMKLELTKKNIGNLNTLFFMVSLENGLMYEKIPTIKNPQIFAALDGMVWVDRCIVVGEIWFHQEQWKFNAISEGVTTPLDTVILSEKSNWSKTAEYFIAEKYGFNAKDWHTNISGKSRQTIMIELIKNAFGLPYSIKIPIAVSNFKNDVYHKYITEPINFFSSVEINEMLLGEKQTGSHDDSKLWRGIYTTIGQPNKPGADGKNPPNSNGPILTEDLLVGYFDKISGQDVLHIVLLWDKPEEGSNSIGWVLPGKRDRAYDKDKGDISIEDANYSLVEKEIKCDRTNIAYHFIVGYFDDRKREQHMKSSGFVSFVLLNEKPELVPGHKIGIPMNGLIQLVRHEITIPRYPEMGESFSLIRNHDSLLLNILETTKFYHIMNKIKIAQAKWRELLKSGPTSKRPQLSEFDIGYDCPICMELLVDSRMICSNGHTICGSCSKQVYLFCPECRSPVLQQWIPNRSLDQIIQNRYPYEYGKRYHELLGHNPLTWKNDAAFNGTHIQYFF